MGVVAALAGIGDEEEEEGDGVAGCREARKAAGWAVRKNESEAEADGADGAFTPVVSIIRLMVICSGGTVVVL